MGWGVVEVTQTGHYEWSDTERRWVKTSDESGQLQTGIWFPNTKYFDKSARRWFHTKSEKRTWMKAKNVVEMPEDHGNPWRGLPESGHHKTYVHS